VICDWEQGIWIGKGLFEIGSRGYRLGEGYLRLGTGDMDWDKVI